MKWGRKKHSSESASSHNSLISHVFPVSWLSMFRQKNGGVGAKTVRVKQEGKQNSDLVHSAKCVDGRRGRFYGGEGDAFWRLSFGEECDQVKTSKGVMDSVWYGSVDKLDVTHSVCQSCGSNAATLMRNEEIHKFKNLILNARKMKELQRNVETAPEMAMFKTEEEAVTKTLRVTTKERKLRKTNQRVSKEKWSNLEPYPNEAEETTFENVNAEFETISKLDRENCKLIRDDLQKHRYISSTNLRNSNLTTVEEDDPLAGPNNLTGNYGISAEKISSEWERLKEMKIKEMKSKSESHRKSLYISRELQKRKTKQNRKVKVGSPRIKALEDMKKATLKLKKGKEKTIDGRTRLESFAVVKCSFNPQKDFRDSMMEMILEKKFSQPQELEELLACYLMLNSDEYHDLIIKVFKQVWFDLNQACFAELQDENYCHN